MCRAVGKSKSSLIETMTLETAARVTPYFLAISVWLSGFLFMTAR